MQKHQVENLLRRYFEDLLSEAEELVWCFHHDNTIDIESEAESADAEEKKLRGQIAKNKFSGWTKTDGETLISKLESGGESIDSETIEEVQRGVLRANAERLRITVAMLRGNYQEAKPQDPLFDGVESPGLPPIPGEEPKSGKSTIAATMERYLDLKSKHDWSAKTGTELKRVLFWFASHIGPHQTVKHVLTDDVRTFRDLLLRVPKRIGQEPGSEPTSFLELVNSAPNDVPTLGLATLKKYFGAVRSYLQWLEDEGYIASSPAKKIQIAKKSSTHGAREPFSGEQLQKLFSSPLYTGHKSANRRSKPGKLVIRDSKFWIPLVALYSGMRLGELVQLRANDAHHHANVFYLDVRSDDELGKSIKTASSQRQVPIHSDLIRMGFWNYVKKRASAAPNGLLFDVTLDASGKQPSKPFSKWFGRYLQLIAIKSDTTSFHSFRHAFTDALRAADIEDSHIKALLGHKDASVTGGYGNKGVPLKLLVQDVERVEFELDLEYLYVDPKQTPAVG